MSTRSPGPRRQHPSGSNRVGFIALGVMALAIMIGLVLLFGGSSESTAELPPDETLSEMQFSDGTMSVVENDRLVMEPFEGPAELEFVIDDADQANFDIAHMQSHSSVALPTRIYYEKQGDVLYARYKEDAPVNSQSAQ